MIKKTHFSLTLYESRGPASTCTSNVMSHGLVVILVFCYLSISVVSETHLNSAILYSSKVSKCFEKLETAMRGSGYIYVRDKLQVIVINFNTVFFL